MLLYLATMIHKWIPHIICSICNFKNWGGIRPAQVPPHPRAYPYHTTLSSLSQLGPYSKKIIFSTTKPEFSKPSDLYLFLVGMELYCTLSHTHTLHLYNYNMYTDVTNSLKILVQVKCWLCYIKRLNWWLQINGSMDQWIYAVTTNPYF